MEENLPSYLKLLDCCPPSEHFNAILANCVGTQFLKTTTLHAVFLKGGWFRAISHTQFFQTIPFIWQGSVSFFDHINHGLRVPFF